MEVRLSNVQTAFDILAEAMGEEIRATNQTGASALQGGDYQSARLAMQQAEQLTLLRERLRALRDEWDRVSGAPGLNGRGDLVGIVRVNPRPLSTPHGAVTPNQAFFRPILQSLVQMGGSAQTRAVLHRVEGILRDVLTETDKLPGKSRPTQPRWHGAAYWARYQMVQDGLLKDGSPAGVWEISDKGREYLTAGDSAQRVD